MPIETVREHFEGFTFEAGNTIVHYKGPWGVVEVWAANEGEGRRVINHTYAVMGWGSVSDEEVLWSVSQGSGKRVGQPGTFAVKVAHGVQLVTTRDGPNGTPIADASA